MRSTCDASTKERTPAAMAAGTARRPGALSLDASPRVVAQRRQIQAAFGPVAQRAISLGTLTTKLQEVKDAHGSYQGTLDDNTSPDVANAVGGQWVGGGAVATYYGASAWDSQVSADGERQYRPPMMKMSGQAEGSAQANYEAKVGAEGGYDFNAHVTITGLQDHESWKKKGDYKPPPKPERKDESDDSSDDGGPMIDLFGDSTVY